VAAKQLRNRQPSVVHCVEANTMPDLPIACTLGPAALKARQDDLLGGLVRRAAERIDIPNGYRVRFDPTDGVLAAIANVIEIERQCCRFLTFRVIAEPDTGPIWLEFSGPPGTREFLAALLNTTLNGQAL
jgi:hypothetical protein